MTLLEVKSSNVEKIGYKDGYLVVKYYGGYYRYVGVPEKTFIELLNSDSKGRFMNDNIKGNYEYSKLTESEIALI